MVYFPVWSKETLRVELGGIGVDLLIIQNGPGMLSDCWQMGEHKMDTYQVLGMRIVPAGM